jgi:Domain of unknown function DUF11
MHKLLIVVVSFFVSVAATIAMALPATAAPETAGGSADLAVVLIVPPGLHVRSVPYVVGINNLGPDTATSATITVRLPRQVVSATGSGCTFYGSNDTATCTFGSIIGDSAVLVELDVRFGALSFGVNLATTATRIASSPADPNPANDSSTATCRANVSLIIFC